MNLKRKLEEIPVTESSKRRKEDKISVFDLGNIRNFDLKFPFFRHPKEVGWFSLDIERKFDDSKQQLKYFVKPPDYDKVEYNLRNGYSTMIRKDETQKEFINDLLRWIIKNRKKFVVPGPASAKSAGPSSDISDKFSGLNTDFICWRGLLTKFLCTPYENREGWIVAVTLHKGTYFLCEFDTEQKKQQNAEKTEREDEMCCWGWKFEQYLTADSPDGKPNTQSPYNNCEAFCTVVRSRLNSHSLVFAGEVDAVHTDKQYGTHYVELKTSREFSHPRQQKSFKRYKLIKWWAQSFLVGIPEIVCGFRDDAGIVHRLQSFNTQSIPNMAKEIPDPWKPNICFNFLDQLLSFIRNTVTVDDHRRVHLLEWSPGNPVTCGQPLQDSAYAFLPDWFTET